VQTQSGSGEATIGTVALYDMQGTPVEFVAVGDKVTLSVQVEVHAPIPELVVGYVIKDRLGQHVFGTNTHHLGKALKALETGEKLEYRFDFEMNLGPGSYSVAVALHANEVHIGSNYEWRDLALVFNVVNTSKPQFVGMAWVPTAVECIR